MVDAYATLIDDALPGSVRRRQQDGTQAFHTARGSPDR
jgi:hypothetical protein